MTAREIIAEVRPLQRQYDKRNEAMKRWYRLLKQEDELKQTNMESFVGNTPRTQWNMAVALLTPKPLTHTVDLSPEVQVTTEIQNANALVAKHMTELWHNKDISEARRGRVSWFRSFVGMLLATGHYAVAYHPNSLFVDYWHPATVYPDYADDPEDGLLRLARVRSIRGDRAIRIATNAGWIVPRGIPDSAMIEEINLWKLLPNNTVSHAVVMGTTQVKTPSIVPDLDHIPVLVGGAGGLPDDGTLHRDSAGDAGQSFLAPNEKVFGSENRMQTFVAQLIRDTANPRVFERSEGNTRIVDPVNWYKRGAFFRGGLQDSIELIATAPIPVEIRGVLLDYAGMIQRGGFSDMTFGNITQRVSSLLVSQATANALQMVEPFYLISEYVYSTISDRWFHAMRENPKLRPKGMEFIPEYKDACIRSTFAIKIPGDFTSRMNSAKQLSPSMELSPDTAMELFLPEITDRGRELAKVRANRASKHPTMTLIELYQAYRDKANTAREQEDEETARLFDLLANRIQQGLENPDMGDRRVSNNGTEPRVERRPVLDQ